MVPVRCRSKRQKYLARAATRLVVADQAPSVDDATLQMQSMRHQQVPKERVGVRS